MFVIVAMIIVKFGRVSILLLVSSDNVVLFKRIGKWRIVLFLWCVVGRRFVVFTIPMNFVIEGLPDVCHSYSDICDNSQDFHFVVCVFRSSSPFLTD